MSGEGGGEMRYDESMILLRIGNTSISCGHNLYLVCCLGIVSIVGRDLTVDT